MDESRAQDEQDTTEQTRILKRILELAEQRAQRADEHSHTDAGWPADPDQAAATHTSRPGEDPQARVDRSEQSSVRSYLSAERTLSVWVRTALALMVLGLAIDRSGLILHRLSSGDTNVSSLTVYTLSGSVLVAFGILMVVTTGLRFMAYARAYRAWHELPYKHGPFLAPLFALLVALFGAALLILMLVFA